MQQMSKLSFITAHWGLSDTPIYILGTDEGRQKTAAMLVHIEMVARSSLYLVYENMITWWKGAISLKNTNYY